MAPIIPSKDWTGTAPPKKEARAWFRVLTPWGSPLHYYLGIAVGVIGLVIMWIQNA